MFLSVPFLWSGTGPLSEAFMQTILLPEHFVNVDLVSWALFTPGTEADECCQGAQRPAVGPSLATRGAPGRAQAAGPQGEEWRE
jgi:hypothetical protein